MSPARDDVRDAACLATFHGTIRQVVEHLGGVHPLDVGWSIRVPDLPAVWSANHVCCTEPSDRATLERLCDALLEDLWYRHLVVEHRATAQAIEDELAAAGWRVERDVIMRLEEPPGPGPIDGVVAELAERQMLELMGRWLREEHVGVGDREVDDVLEFNRRVGRLWGERRLGVVADDGAPLAVTKLRLLGSLGWVEDVYCVPDARNNGFATALVTTAARAALDAGCTDVVIVADADDWPQHLYARNGFRPIGSSRIFHRVMDE